MSGLIIPSGGGRIDVYDIAATGTPARQRARDVDKDTADQTAARRVLTGASALIDDARAVIVH